MTEEQIFKYWLAQGKPDLFTYGGQRWMAITDNDKMRFIPQGQTTNFDGKYTQTTKEH